MQNFVTSKLEEPSNPEGKLFVQTMNIQTWSAYALLWVVCPLQKTECLIQKIALSNFKFETF